MARDFAEKTSLIGPSGDTARVEDGCLIVNPKSAFTQAVEDGWAFSWASLTYNVTAADTMFALENVSAHHILCIEKVIISVSVAGGSVCPVFTASGTTLSVTTSVAGVNLNRGSGNLCASMTNAGTIEVGQNEAATSWLKRCYMPQCVTGVPYIIDVGGAIRLPNDHLIAVDAIGDPAAANVTFIGWFEPI